jgi:hypothetical protein
VIALAAGISCDHVVVVPCHEKVAANACAVEVLGHAVGSGMEAGVASGVLGVTASAEAVVCSELGEEAQGEPGAENEAVAVNDV